MATHVGSNRHTIDKTTMGNTGNRVVYTSPDGCITVGTGGRPGVPGTDLEASSPSMSRRLDSRELAFLGRPTKDMRPRIRRVTLGSLEPKGSLSAFGAAWSCMPKVRTRRDD